MKRDTIAHRLNLIEKAVKFATIAHAGQVRKGTAVPYIVHPYTVGLYLQDAGCRAEVVAAGILHDVLEDTATDMEALKASFGNEIAELVAAVSEQDKGLPWEVRKRHSLDVLKASQKEVCMVACADKLHNLRAIICDIEEYGDSVWQRFNRGREEQAWYYRSLLGALDSLNGHSLYEAYKEAVSQCFGMGASHMGSTS